MIENIPSPGSARGRHAYLVSKGFKPTDVEIVEAKARLLCSNIDASVRRFVQQANEGSPVAIQMDDVHVAHLCGLIMGESGVKYEAVRVIEGIIRDAVVAAQSERA